MTHIKENNQPIETDPELAQLSYLLDKDIKTVTVTV